MAFGRPKPGSVISQVSKTRQNVITDWGKIGDIDWEESYFHKDRNFYVRWQGWLGND